MSKMKEVFPLSALALLLLTHAPAAEASSFHVCGNYCGPGYCNGEWLEEADCDDSVAPESHSATGPSCADVCCQAHDACCGHGDRTVCNTNIVNCLSECDKASLTCTLDGVPVPAGGIEAAMDIVENWCCGSPCTSEELASSKNSSSSSSPAHGGVEGVEVVVGLKLRNLDRLEAAFWEISDPKSDRYLQHLNLTSLRAMIGPSPSQINAAKEWLLSQGASPEHLKVSALSDTVSGYVSPSASGLSSTPPPHFDFVLKRAQGPPPGAGEKPRARPTFSGENSVYSVPAQKKAYGIPGDLTATNDATLQMVWGPGTFGYSADQLRELKEAQVPLLNLNKVQFDTENHGVPGGDNYGEGNLDTQMISSFGLNISTLVSNTNTSSTTEEGNGFGAAMLDFVTALASRDTLPQVLSLSLGSLSAYSCDLLCSEAVSRGHTLQECNAFLQEQRQVCMFIDQDQVARINTAFQILGTRGVSVFGSSGDGGSHFSFQPFGGTSSIASTLNDISCDYQMPVFPTGSPYVTSVGGTTWKGFIRPDPTQPVAWSGSGGGFSWEFSRAEHQDTLVTAYLDSVGASLPPSSSYNATGRGYPDVSAVSVDGTSQSSPTMAGIFSLITDFRLNAGLPPLGFLGPRLYAVAEKYPGEAFEDVTEGNSKTSCSSGFPCAKGWDPVTGLGRPVWEGMKKHFASDDSV